MATKLSDIEKKYAAIMRAQNSPISFGEYIKGQSAGIKLDANESRLKTITDAEKMLSANGKLAESLAVRGLSNSGFAKYARAAVEAKRDKALKEADRAEDNAFGKLKENYHGYLDSYAEKQNSLRQSVIKELTKRRELNPETIYRYAADAGLGESGAKNMYNDVYKAVSYYIKDSILERIYAGELSADTAASVARSMGLWGDDVEEMRSAAERFNAASKTESDEYFAQLESMSDQITNLPIGFQMFYQSLQEKKGK